VSDVPDLPPSRLPTLTVADRQVIHDGFIRLEVIGMDTRVHGKPARLVREVHDHGDGAAVLAYDPAARVAVLVRQVRAAAVVAGSDGVLIEAIAGLVEHGEDAGQTARREAMEEAGLDLVALTPVGRPYSSPGTVTERVHLFLAIFDRASVRGAGGGNADEHEEIEILELPLDDLAALADAGIIEDLKTLFLIETLRRREPDLFSPR
jgi:nudix-type nucleoside diphosphatase (YffH/AdpP family)